MRLRKRVEQRAPDWCGKSLRLNQQFSAYFGFSCRPAAKSQPLRSIPMPKARNRPRSDAVFKYARRRRPRRRPVDRAKQITCARGEFHQRRALLILLALFGRPLLRPWNGNAAFSATTFTASGRKRARLISIRTLKKSPPCRQPKQ